MVARIDKTNVFPLYDCCCHKHQVTTSNLPGIFDRCLFLYPPPAPLPTTPLLLLYSQRHVCADACAVYKSSTSGVEQARAVWSGTRNEGVWANKRSIHIPSCYSLCEVRQMCTMGMETFCVWIYSDYDLNYLSAARFRLLLRQLLLFLRLPVALLLLLTWVDLPWMGVRTFGGSGDIPSTYHQLRLDAYDDKQSRGVFGYL